MIGAEARIAEGYHAFKAGDLDRVEQLLSGIPHPRAEALLAMIAQQRASADVRSDPIQPAN